MTKFTLEMQGGKKGLLRQLHQPLHPTNRAIAEFTGQNGKTLDFNPVLQAPCGKKAKKKRQGAGQQGLKRAPLGAR